MEAVSIPGRSRRAGVRRLLAGNGPGPWLTLVAGALLVAIGAGLIAAHVTVFSLDESLIEQSAVHYASNLPHSLLHDLDARATNRLYPLILSIAYRLGGGPGAVRADRLISVAMFVSAVFPIYLMARELLASRWAAVAVGLLSIALPWLALTSALFTENLSYPIFWWTMLALCAAVWRPAPRRDLVTLVCVGLLIGTRVQFASLFVGYLLCLTVACWGRAAGALGVRARLRGATLAAVRGFPFAIALSAVVLAGLLYARASGEWHAHVHRLLGSYTNVVIRADSLPSNMTEGVLIELIALALGIGLLPAIVSIPWYLRRLSRPEGDRRWAFLAVTGAVLVVFVGLTVYSQNGYLGVATEERYFFYVVPVLWIGAFAAVAEGRLRAREIVLSAACLAALFGSIAFLSPLSEETAFLAPVESVVPHVLALWLSDLGLTGLTIQDSLAVGALAAGLLTALVWARRPALRGWWTLGAAAVLQLLITGYAFAAIDGAVPGVQGRTSGSSAALGWVDTAAGGRPVTWLANLSSAVPAAIDVPAAGAAADQSHVTLFWNSQIRSAAVVRAAAAPPLEFPVSSLPHSSLQVDTHTGLLAPAPAASAIEAVIGETGSPFLQLVGTPLGHSLDGLLTLSAVSRPARASWIAGGLQPDGYIAGTTPVHVQAFRAPGADGALRVLMTLAPMPTPAAGVQPVTEVDVTLGGHRVRVPLQAGSAARQVSITACPSQGSDVIQGTLTATRTIQVGARPLAAALGAVTVTAVPGSSCATAQG